MADFCPIYENPTTIYQEFVNAFQRKEGRYRNKKDIVKAANDSWNEIKKTKEQIQIYINSAPKPVARKFKQKKLTFSTETRENTPTTVSPQPENPDSIASDGNVTGCSKKLNPPNASVVNTPDSNEVFLDREKFISGQEDSLCKEFLVSILESDADKVLQDQQLFSEVIFKKTLLNTARAWNEYYSLVEDYSKNKQKSRSSSLQKTLQNINEVQICIKRSFMEIAEIKVHASIGVSLLAANVSKKMAKVLDIVKLLGEVTSLYSDNGLLKSLRKRIVQQETTLRSILHRKKEEKYEISCMNSCNLTWEDTFETLLVIQNGNRKFKTGDSMLSVDEVIKIGTLLQESTAVSTEELKTYLPRNLSDESSKNLNIALKQILVAFPLLILNRGKTKYFVNMHQMEFNCSELDELFGLTIEDSEICEVEVEKADATGKGKKESRKGGRSSVVDKFPEIPNVATEFIKNNGYRAQERRRESTFQSCGVTVSEIRDHLLENIPGLKEHGLAVTTVRYLFKAVKKGTFSAERYKGHIDAKVARKDNSSRRHHINGHYLHSRIKLRGEFATCFKEEVTSVSCDSMNKLKVGTLAVSRYHQIRKIFMADDQPVYPDHDFPLVYKLIPDGIMLLNSVKERYKPVNEGIFHQNKGSNECTRLIQKNEICESYEVHKGRLDQALLRAGYEGGEIETNVFENVSWELKHRLSLEVTVPQLQESLLNQLSSEMDKYINFYDCSNNSTKKENYVNGLRQLQTTSVCEYPMILPLMYAISSIYDITIILYTSHTGVPFVVSPPNDTSFNMIFLALNACPEKEHFCRVNILVDERNLVTLGEMEEHSDCDTEEENDGIEIEDNITDSSGRQHYKCSQTGPVVTYIRNNIFHSSTCLEHANDLFPICTESVRSGKTIFICYVDNGPDYNPSSYKNLLMYGRLWQAANLDLFNVGSHAAGLSAYNPIEHAWSPLSRRLTCVTLSACDENETVPPCKNSHLTKEEKEVKEMKILDRAANEFSRYWTGATYDGFPVVPIPVESKGRNEPFPTADDIVAVLEAPVRDIKAGKHKAVMDEFRFFAKHCDRRHNEITFLKCQFFRDDICDYCAKKKNILSEES